MPESHLLLSCSLEGQYGHQTVDTLAFFYCVAHKKFKLSAPFTQCAHTHNWKRQYLFAFCQYHMEYSL